MLHQSSTKRNRYQEQKALRLNQAISNLTIESDIFGLFSLVPSTTNRLDIYAVVIEDGRAVRCTCKGCKEHGYYCIHMQATQFVLDAMIEDANSPTPDEEAAIAEERNMQKLALYKESIAHNAYECLAPTKDVTHAYGCCGHIVKPQHAGELCGSCLCK